jgi:hypothetical protein
VASYDTYSHLTWYGTCEMLLQILSCPVSVYRDHKVELELSIQYTVAACVHGVAPEGVTNILLTATTMLATDNNLRGAVNPRVEDDMSLLTYRVTSHDPEMTYEQLKTEIEDAYSDGRFLDYLHHYAALYNLPALLNVTASAPIVHEVPAGSDNSSAFGAAEIVSVAIGGVMAILLVVVGIRFWLHISRSE